MNFSTVEETLGFGLNLNVELGIKVKIPGYFGLRVKLHLPHFGQLNSFLKLRAVVHFMRHVQQCTLKQAIFARTENFVQYNRDLQDNLRLCSTTYEEAPRFVFVAHYNLGHEIKKREMDRTCGIRRTTEVLTRFRWDNLRKRDVLEDGR